MSNSPCSAGSWWICTGGFCVGLVEGAVSLSLSDFSERLDPESLSETLQHPPFCSPILLDEDSLALL